MDPGETDIERPHHSMTMAFMNEVPNTINDPGMEGIMTGHLFASASSPLWPRAFW